MIRPASEPEAGVPSGKRRGATAIEYAFVASLILVGCVIGVQSVSGVLKKSTSTTSNSIQKAIKK